MSLCVAQFLFAFEFECEWPNGNLAVYKSFEPRLVIHTEFFFILTYMANFWPYFFNKKDVKISEKPNGNMAIHKSFCWSNSNLNANGI